MLNSITLENWRSHSKTKIEFSEGTNVFLGQMGSGKSSVVDALCFALYGTYPKLRGKEAKLEDVKNFRHKQKQASVEVQWSSPAESNGKLRQYKIRRELSPPNAWLYEDEKLLCKGARQASEQASQILQISYELFSRAAYSEQNGIDYWFNLNPGARKAELDKLLGLDRFESARSGAVKEINRLKERASLFQKDADLQKLQKLQQEAKERGDRVQAQKKIAQEAGKSLEEALKKAQEAQTLHDKAKIKCSQLSKLSVELNLLKGKTSALEKNTQECASLPDLQKLSQEEGEARVRAIFIEKTLKSLQAEEGALSQSIGKLKEQEASAKNSQEKRKKLQAELISLLNGVSAEKIKEQIKNMQAQAQEMAENHAMLEVQRKSALNAIKALEGGSHTGCACPVCESPLDEKKKKELYEKNSSLSLSIGKEIEQSKKLAGKKQGEISNLSTILEKASRIDAGLQALPSAQNLPQISEQLRTLRKMQEEFAKKRENCAKEAKKLSDSISQLQISLQKHAQLKKWNAELSQCKARMAQLQEMEINLSPCKLEFENASARLSAALSQKASLEEQCRGAAAILESMQSSLEIAKESLAQAQKKRDEMQLLLQEADSLEKFRQVVIATQSQLRETLISDINSALARLWPMLYPYNDWSGAKIVAGQKDYSLQVFQGEYLDLQSHASGGERACMGLCLRAALSIILTPQLGWLILDEPTHNLDSQAVQALGRALSEKMPHIISQVIVITHEPRLLESAPARVFEFSRDKEKGEDTQVFAAD
ncbi:hypothetical protein COU37_04565 [Candidatus Micrarchaeota archaeon CG10_big_fil_rev_8_21_14_0_10_45_29]|nr:MAG: hypothetical protein COU37_04565 [Candidatus Micrarchaeota archaeon CG10_big_fil_rev_8_21_14_0_10_45_29]